MIMHISIKLMKEGKGNVSWLRLASLGLGLGVSQEKGGLPRLAKASSAHIYPSLATPIIRMPATPEPVLPLPFLAMR